MELLISKWADAFHLFYEGVIKTRPLNLTTYNARSYIVIPVPRFLQLY